MSVWEEEFARIAQRRPLSGPPSWQLAVVSKVEPQTVQLVGLPPTARARVPFAEMTWAAPTLAEQRLGAPPRSPKDVVSVGDVIVVEKVEKPAGQNAKPYPPKTYALRQVPNVEGGVVVMDTQTGRVLAMSGGWSYGRSQFNRAVQAARQPGSSFKPFVYLAAMDNGFTPASIVLDAPFSYDPGYGQPIWTPKNYGGDYLGPTTVRRGLEAVAQPHDRAHGPADRHEEGGRGRQGIRRRRPDGRLPADGAGRGRDHAAAHDHGLRHAGQRRAGDHAEPGRPRAGPQRQDRLPPRAARLQRAAASRLAPASPSPPEIVDSRKPFHDPASVYQVVHMMLGVTTRGTAGRLAALGRPIAGKTGTTNDARDNWFLGSTPDITIGIYIGFDEPSTLGHGNLETGGGNAAPIYEAMAKQIFKDKPPTPFRIPPGLRMVKWTYEGGTIDEVFKPGTEPGCGGLRPAARA